jgi:hypothetical protein
MLEDEIGELDEKQRLFVAVCELCAPQNHMGAYRWIGNGCPPHHQKSSKKSPRCKPDGLCPRGFCKSLSELSLPRNHGHCP